MQLQGLVAMKACNIDPQIYDPIRLRFRGINELSKTSNRISDSGSYPDPADVPSRVTWVLLVVGGPGTGGEHARPDLRSFGSEPSSGTPGALFLLIFAQIYHKDLCNNRMKR